MRDDPVIRARPNGKIEKLVAIGTSTGGPKALQAVLSRLPAEFPAPILIVQHMPPGFTRSLAERLDAVCQIRVYEAQEGQRIEPGSAYIAPGNYHMGVAARANGDLVIRLDGTAPPRSGHRPSVDHMLESIADLDCRLKVAVIMTGMGNDGSQGLKRIKERQAQGVFAIAEDASTCVVFGMPRAVIELGLADSVLPLDKIAEKILDVISNNGGDSVGT